MVQPGVNVALIDFEGGRIFLRVDRDDSYGVMKASQLPGAKFLKGKQAWVAPASLKVFNFLNNAFPDATWGGGALVMLNQALERAAERDSVLQQRYGEIDTSGIDPIEFKTSPYKHQVSALALGSHLRSFGYLMDQGTGKTWVLINDMAINWWRGIIEASVVLVPNSIKFQWESAIAEHSTADTVVGVWNSQPNAEQRAAWRKFEEQCEDKSKLVWVIVNVEAVAMPRVYKWLEAFMCTRKVALSVDESTRIKNRTAKRTKAAISLRNFAQIARIMSGTPVVKSPMDAFAQFKFLDPDILGYSNFYPFRNHFGVMGGYQNKQVVTYKNMDELAELITSCSYRVTKEECLDLPPKMPPVRRDVQMAPKQKQEYVRMKKEFLALIDEVCSTCQGAGYVWIETQSPGRMETGASHTCPTCGGSRCAVHATIALTQLLRLQQIASGFIMDGQKFLHWFTDKPPKIMETMDLLEECGDQQIILWSNHKPEIHRLVQELALRGLSYVEYHGDVRPEVREQYRVAFQRGDHQYMVGHPAAGGIGVDLWAASGAAYLSNSFKTEDRVQSEDRCHRIGSEIHDSVNYWDIIVPGTVDVTVLRVIRNNRSVSDEIMAGGLRRLLNES